jgi:RHS repeat-associated protein
MEDGTGVTTYTFDELNRLETVTYPAGKTLTYVYDAMGNRSALTDPDGGLTTYSFDSRNLLSWLVNPLAERTTWLYDALGRVTTMTHGNASIAEYDYDNARRISAVRNLKSDRSVISVFTYSYDSIGNRTSQAEANGDLVTWSYDETYQLTREQRSGDNAYDTTFTYDGVGNRLTQVASGASTTYAYDAANELTTSEDTAGVTTFTYDANGNRMTKTTPANQVVTHAWDAENRMVVFTDANAQATTFSYDGDGRLRQRQDTGGTVKVVWDGENMLLETDNAGATQRAYTLEPVGLGNLVSQRQAGASKEHHFDAIGSTRHLSDSSQATTDARDFKAFGLVNASSGSTANRFWFIGRHGYWDDPIGYLLLRARWYDAENGVFLGRDPIHYSRSCGPAKAHVTMPAYRYSANNPVNWADPSGMLTGQGNCFCLSMQGEVGIGPAAAGGATDYCCKEKKTGCWWRIHTAWGCSCVGTLGGASLSLGCSCGGDLAGISGDFMMRIYPAGILSRIHSGWTEPAPPDAFRCALLSIGIPGEVYFKCWCNTLVYEERGPFGSAWRCFWG